MLKNILIFFLIFTCLLAATGIILLVPVSQKLTSEDAGKTINLKIRTELLVTLEGNPATSHPGGMLPLTEKEASSFHSDRLPEDLYVADASLLPKSLGNPPILMIIAMAKRISKICIQKNHVA